MRKNLTNFCFIGATVILLMMIAVMAMGPPIMANTTTNLTGNDAGFINSNSSAAITSTCVANADQNLINADGFRYDATATFSARDKLGLENTSSEKTDVVDNGRKSNILGNVTQTKSLIETSIIPAYNQNTGIDGEKVYLSLTVATGTYFLSSSFVNVNRRSGETANTEGVTPVSGGAILKKPMADFVDFSIDGAAITRTNRTSGILPLARLPVESASLVADIAPIRPIDYRIRT